MEARKIFAPEDIVAFIINELSKLDRESAEQWLDVFWQTKDYQALKQKLITQPECMSSEELICFALTRDGGEEPYDISLQQLKQAIEDKKDVLTPATLSHLTIILKVMSRDDVLNYNKELKDEFFRLYSHHYRHHGFINFAKINLSNMNLKLFRTGFRNTYLVRANLSHSIFPGASNVNLSFADLSHSQCQFPIEKANLSDANLSYANIDASSSFEYVNLTRANLTGTQLNFYAALNINFQMALFNKTYFDLCSFKNDNEFFSSPTSLSQLKGECAVVMSAMLTCMTTSKKIHEESDRPDDINKQEFDENIYVAIAKDLISKLDTVDNATLEEKIAFINDIYHYFEPKSKANNFDIAKGAATFIFKPDNLLNSTLSKDIWWARLFGTADARTKSQEILHAAKIKMTEACPKQDAAHTFSW